MTTSRKPIFICFGLLLSMLSPVSAYASRIDLPDVSNPGADYGRLDDILLFADIEFPLASANANMIILLDTGKPDHVPPANPPFDTPAFNKGLVNTPAMMPASVPYHTLPGSSFGQLAIPIPAAAWLFGSGLLGLIGMARCKKA